MEMHDLKTRLQDHFSDGLVTIVGSGLSCAEGLPGMAELADHLCASVGLGIDARDVALWQEIAPLIEANGLEAALLQRDLTPGLEDAIAAATAELMSARERMVITEVFAGTSSLRLTRLVPHLMKPTSGLPFVTTNYDRLIEIAVEEAGLGVDTMFFGRFAGVLNEKESRLSFCRNVLRKGKKSFSLEYRPRAVIYKPHGSLDWYLRGGTPVQYAGDLPDATRLIITPGKNKFRDGYESPFDRHREKANAAIDGASRFLVLGYGFNDDHLQTHLSPAIIGGKPTLLMARSLTEKAEALAKGNANVVALDSSIRDGKDGTRVIIDRAESFFAGLSLWDVNSFVKEVLEP